MLHTWTFSEFWYCLSGPSKILILKAVTAKSNYDSKCKLRLRLQKQYYLLWDVIVIFVFKCQWKNQIIFYLNSDRGSPLVLNSGSWCFGKRRCFMVSGVKDVSHFRVITCSPGRCIIKLYTFFGIKTVVSWNKDTSTKFSCKI